LENAGCSAFDDRKKMNPQLHSQVNFGWLDFGGGSVSGYLVNQELNKRCDQRLEAIGFI
jgi:hypothetical protein